VSYEDYPSVVQLFVVVRSYIGGHLRVYPQLCVGASQVDFDLLSCPYVRIRLSTVPAQGMTVNW
jgi:hypothetical protein